MLYSMTGFGKAVVQTPARKITVEVKSLNSKQADISARIPSLYREYELMMRSKVAQTLQRGKIDLTVQAEAQGADTAVHLNVDVAAAYKMQILAMAKELNLPEPADWYATLLRLPEVFRADTLQQADPAEASALMEALGQAIEALMDYRATEGRKLEEFFTCRIERIREYLGQVPKYEGERVEKIRIRIAEGLEKFVTMDYDKGRLEQEMFFYIEKLDINEEKQRLAQHLDYFMQTMAQSDGGQGKKLGFITQEMGREINTLGSKSNHAELQCLVVRMKDELEQIKEQVLNVM